MRGNTNTKGKVHTEETKAKMSASKLGNKCALGVKHSEEHKAKCPQHSERGALPPLEVIDKLNGRK